MLNKNVKRNYETVFHHRNEMYFRVVRAKQQQTHTGFYVCSHQSATM